MSVSPPIDRRKFEQLLEEFYQRVPFYTPEWRPGSELELDSALVKIFNLMLIDTIDRLNQSPPKHFIAFLNMLGVKLLPALQARVPVTFYLSTGATTPVILPAKMQVAANSPTGGEPIPFETEKLILATSAKLVDAYSVNPKLDQVFRAPTGFLGETAIAPFTAQLSFVAQPGDAKLFLDTKADLQPGDLLKIGEGEEADYVEVGKPAENKVELNQVLKYRHSSGQLVNKVRIFELFEGLDQQAHILYLGHKNLFQIKDQVTIELVFSGWDSALIGDIRWEYYGKQKDSEEQQWFTFDEQLRDGTKNILILNKKNLDELKELEIHAFKGYWIRGVVNPNQIKTCKGIEIDTLSAIVKPFTADSTTNPGIIPELAFHNDIPLDPKQTFYPFGQKPSLFDTFYFASQEAFSKQGSQIELNITVVGSVPTSQIPVERVQGIGQTFRERLTSSQIVTVEDLLARMPTELAGILGTTTNRAENILDAARREFYDRAAPSNLDAIGSQNPPVLSWEYWNGKGWVKLPLEPSSANENFLAPSQRSIHFICPIDMDQITVSGQQNYWIRVRLISGDYGREEFSVDPNQEGKIITTSNFYPPQISGFKINYHPPDGQSQGFPLETCLTLNHLTFQDRTEESQSTGKPFQPFQALDDAHQTLYLGFDAAPLKGPISLFASLEIQDYTERNHPRVQWEYFRQRDGQGEWSRLDVVDGTNNLTRSGTIVFVGLPDFASITYFGKTLYWIRAIDVQDRFKPLERAISQQLESQRSPQTKFSEMDGNFAGLQPCAQPLQLIRSPFLSAQLQDVAPSPQFKSLFLNTTWASQAESFSEQILGSSDGTKNQTFSFFKFPVIAEEVWVNELSALSTGEREALLTQSDRAISEIKDDSGNTTAFWVRWDPVEDLLDSAATDRHYTIDRTFGQFQFGDGIEGAVPPIGVDNIRATYQAGGGSRGNVEAGSITVLKSSIGFVERVTNWEAAGGGSDTELIDQALARGSQMLKHRHRAVAAEDFERLAHLASRSIARVKCLPNFNDEGQSKTGWVTVIIVPQSADPQPKPDPLLKQQVEIYLRDRTASVVTAPRHLVVISPVYVEVSITTTLIATVLETVTLVEKAAIEQLNTFLHPLLGSDTRMGWDFGQLPCLSDFYGLLEAIAGLDHVQALTMTLNVPQNPSILVTTEQPLEVTLPAYILVSSGRHQVTVQGLTFS